ncbi:MAG: radical SAM protein [candidate division Zixibacteria bacterium]|nr:radical SAM protein [Candidatus Tariuqbacter arcticus]
MRILLIQAYLGRREKPIYPLGLAYLSAMLKDYEIQVIDPNILNDPLGDLRKVIIAFQPEIIGISLRNMDTTQIRDPFVYLSGFSATLEVVKQSAPQAFIIAGGSGFSMFARELMNRFPQIDCGTYLEGEYTLPELAAKFPDLEDVKGVFIRRDGETVFNGVREFPVLDELPFPDWENVPVEPYKHLLDAVGVQTKRGCGLKCAYCSYPFLNGDYYRYRPPESVGEEVERLVKDYGVERFIFVDSVFNIPRKHAELVLREIIMRKIEVKWTGWYNERAMDRGFTELALEAGCELFSFSPDGFSDAALKALGKNLRKDDILRVFEMMKDYPQAIVSYNFFLNPPGQTLSDLLKLLWFSVKVRLAFRGRLCGFLLGSIRIEPDTAIFKRAVEEGFISEDTPMLVSNRDELLKLFYKPPKSGSLNLLLKLYIALRNIRHTLMPPKEL